MDGVGAARLARGLARVGRGLGTGAVFGLRLDLGLLLFLASGCARLLLFGFSWTSPSAEIGLRFTPLAINAVQLELRGLRNTKSVVSTCAFL
jgi:hypothetical protein